MVLLGIFSPIQLLYFSSVTFLPHKSVCVTVCGKPPVAYAGLQGKAGLSERPGRLCAVCPRLPVSPPALRKGTRSWLCTSQASCVLTNPFLHSKNTCPSWPSSPRLPHLWNLPRLTCDATGLGPSNNPSILGCSDLFSGLTLPPFVSCGRSLCLVYL